MRMLEREIEQAVTQFVSQNMRHGEIVSKFIKLAQYFIGSYYKSEDYMRRLVLGMAADYWEIERPSELSKLMVNKLIFTKTHDGMYALGFIFDNTVLEMCVENFDTNLDDILKNIVDTGFKKNVTISLNLNDRDGEFKIVSYALWSYFRYVPINLKSTIKFIDIDNKKGYYCVNMFNFNRMITEGYMNPNLSGCVVFVQSNDVYSTVKNLLREEYNIIAVYYTFRTYWNKDRLRDILSTLDDFSIQEIKRAIPLNILFDIEITDDIEDIEDIAWYVEYLGERNIYSYVRNKCGEFESIG